MGLFLSTPMIPYVDYTFWCLEQIKAFLFIHIEQNEIDTLWTMVGHNSNIIDGRVFILYTQRN